MDAPHWEVFMQAYLNDTLPPPAWAKDIIRRLENVMTTQDDINTAFDQVNGVLATINTGVASLVTANAAVETQLAAVQAQLDSESGTTSAALADELSKLQTLVTSANAIAAELPAPAPVTPPVVPTDPTTPVDPTNPAPPVDPTAPADPSTPVTPVDPTAPVGDGSGAAGAGTPADPSAPVDPSAPAGDGSTPVPVDPTAAPTTAGTLNPTTPVVEVPAHVIPVQVPAGATVIAAGQLPSDAVVTPVV